MTEQQTTVAPVEFTGAELYRLAESMAYDIEAIRSDLADAQLNSETGIESTLSADLSLMTSIAAKLQQASAELVRPRLFQLLAANELVSTDGMRFIVSVSLDRTFANWTLIPEQSGIGAYGFVELDSDLNPTKLTVWGPVTDGDDCTR